MLIIRDTVLTDLPTILEIYNDAIENLTAPLILSCRQ